jgi:hypothetical protein
MSMALEMNPDGPEELIRALMQRGYTRDKAEEYAFAVADTPELDPHGRWVIRDDQGRVIDAIEPLEDD